MPRAGLSRPADESEGTELSGEDRTNGGARVLTSIDAGIPTTYPNHERSRYAVRAFVGSLPVTVWIVALWPIVLYFVLTGQVTWLEVVVLIPVSAGLVAVGVFSSRSIEQRTPGAITLGPDSLTARWGGRDLRTELVPFDRIVTVDARRWAWTSGKGAHARFLPASVLFRRTLPDTTAGGSGDGTSAEQLYLTDRNADVVRRAFRTWSAAHPESRLPDLLADPAGPGAWGLVDR
jgi:hypothetical protein